MIIFRQDVPTQKLRDRLSVTFLDSPAVSQQEACRMYRITIYVDTKYGVHLYIIRIIIYRG
jgi:hypothetical protein